MGQGEGYDPSTAEGQYFAAPAAFFVIFGLKRIRLILLLTVLVLVLHLAAWFLFPREKALIEVDAAMLDQLYVTAAVTTLTMIGAVVYYAFRLSMQQAGSRRNSMSPWRCASASRLGR